MAYKQTFTRRLTHKYVDSWSHLDSWDHKQYTFKMLQRKCVDEGNGLDDTGTYIMRVIGSKREDQEIQRKVLNDNLSYHGCSHEYDCCGCPSASATVRRIKPGIFSVLIRTGRNY